MNRDATDVAPPAPKRSVVLEPWGQGLPRAGQWRNGFAIVDFDGDGQLDIVHGPARKSATRVPQIFAGDGAGTFKLLTRYTFPDLPYDYGDVAVADFDGDGALDLAVASHLIGVAVLVRRGDTFEPYATEIGLLGVAPKVAPKAAAPKLPMTGFSSRAIEAADWNGDGRADLIVSSDGPRPFQALHGGAPARHRVAVLVGKPGGFEPVFPVTDLPAHGDSLVVAELDPTPGLEILAAANVVGSRNLLYRKTDAGLALGELPGAPDERVVRAVATLAHPNGPPRLLLGGLAMGKHGLEGTLDLVQLSASPGAETTTQLFGGEPLRAISAIATGDLDADGQSEVAFGDEQGTLRVLESDGEALAQTGQVTPRRQLAGCAVYAIAFMNLDGRAGDEVVVSYAGDDGACPSSGGIEIYRRVAK
jgi:hypothetical protein